MVEKDIPSGWSIMCFKDACDKISLNGIKVKEKEYDAYGKFPVIDQGKKPIGGYFSDDKLVVSGEPPFIIFGDHTKVKKYINFKFIAGGDGLKVLKAKDFFDPKLFYYFIHSIKLPEKGYARHFQYLEKSEIPVPPFPEQKRIVAKIEEIFSELENSIGNMKAAQQKLKVYRQAVLKWAFDGKLTEEWREKQKDLPSADILIEQIKELRLFQYNQLIDEWKMQLKESKHKGEKEPSRPKKLAELSVFDNEYIKNFPALPTGWCYIGIEPLLSLRRKGMVTGPFGTSLKKSEHRKTGVPVLGIENIGEGVFVAGNKIFVDKDKAAELSAFQVNIGDIIISRSGTVGEICSIPEGIEHALISTNLMSVSLNDGIIKSKYFVYLFQSKGIVIDQVKELCKGSTRIFLNQTILKSIVFPLAKLEEQELIISEIESRLSVCDKMEESIEQSLSKAEVLRQSILKKAFDGKLLPQDTNDEPAEKFIERIRAEKEVQKSEIKTTKRRTKK